MNRFASFVLIILISALTAYATLRMMPPSSQPMTKKETAFERVTRTNILRCGYYTQRPVSWKDDATGKMDGWGVRVTEDLGKMLNLKIEWAEEVTFGNMFAGLDTNRYDAICPGAWVNGARGRVSQLGREFLFSAVGVIARQDDHRFNDDLSRINQPDVTISVIDRELSETIAEDDFPKAKILPLPQNVDNNQVFIDIVNKKADVTFGERSTVNLFIEQNPGSVKLLGIDQPVRVYPWAMAVKKGEHDLISLLNAGMTELIYSGAIERRVRQYQTAPDSYIFVPRFGR